MYTAEINRRRPACLLLLVDQSFSMSEQWGTGPSKADALALSVNRLLGNAVIQCSKGDNRVLDYFEIGVIGYGGEVQFALHGTDAGRPLLPISQVADNPRRIDEVMRKEADGAGGIIQVPMAVPVWVDATANGPTPMVGALGLAEQVLSGWCSQHANSFPPIVINLTDGVSTDGDPRPVAERVRSVRTDDGPALMFNVHLSSSSFGEVLLPNSAGALPDDYASLLFEMSSELPVQMAEAAAGLGYAVQPGARGFLYNAQATSVIEFLDIGTRPITPSGRRELLPGPAQTT
ncbi:VWA domain-containing protein [Actinokineospora sp. PR83]|uniref:VWA domain-containing protein n=1 Tax=Actinokineospora sp. PR83 TaxID=2884908 RepID=UPI001F241A0C|nr:VWA domain-containing protein [Actinokineospora sp. PR83]MCG8918135.1 VWA domain-containing protein [Actinokineospora sp. PR83]